MNVELQQLTPIRVLHRRQSAAPAIVVRAVDSAADETATSGQ